MFLALASLSFSSCFETVEEISLKEDGSGKMTLTFNGSESKAKIASLLKLRSVNGRKVPSITEIKNELARTVAQLKAIPGISNVSSSSNFDNYIIALSFDFEDLAQVNTAFSKVLSGYDIPAYNAARYHYNKTSRTFSKTYSLNANTKKQYEELSAEDKDVFRNARYTSVYRFARMVKSQTNEQAKLSASKKAVMQQTPILNIIRSGASINNTVRLQ